MAFIRTPQFLVLLLLLCAQAAFWVFALVPVVGTVYRRFVGLRTQQALQAGTVASVTASALFLLALGVLFDNATRYGISTLVAFTKLPTNWPLAHHNLKVTVIVLVPVLLGMLAIVGVWLVGIALQNLPFAATPTKADVESYLEGRNDLNTLIGVAAVIIGLGTLSTGALRNAVLALNPSLPAQPIYQFDTQYLLVYGLFYTGLLAIAFAPSYLALREAGARLRERAHPLPAPQDPAFSSVVSDRKTLDEFLQLDLFASATVKAGLAIITPLITSLIALLIPRV